MSHALDGLRALERTLGGVAHDVANPLAAIVGYAQLASIETDPTRRSRYLESVLSQAEAIRRLVTDLQAAASTAAPPNDRVRLSDVAALATMGSPHAVEVLDDAEVTGDREALVMAVRKLLDNAVAATRELQDGRVHVRIGRRDGQACLSVLDSGPGFAEGALHHAFAPDFTTRRTGNGIGLGLCVALSVAERHGGRVELEPAGLATLGRPGASVHLLLPLAATPAAPGRL